MARDQSGDVYAGILIRPNAIEVTFGEVIAQGRPARPLDLHRIAALPDRAVALEGAGPPAVKRTAEILRGIVSDMLKDVPHLRGIGVACAGPLRSVAIEDRKAVAEIRETPEQRERRQKQEKQRRVDAPIERHYGMVWNHAVHERLRKLDIYKVVTDALGDRAMGDGAVECRVHHDVACGALAESLVRTVPTTGKDKPLIMPGNTVFFLQVAEGVGGGFAAGGRPWVSTPVSAGAKIPH